MLCKNLRLHKIEIRIQSEDEKKTRALMCTWSSRQFTKGELKFASELPSSKGKK